MRGSSGAKITIENDHVRKIGTNGTEGRVRGQGIWLRKYDESLCLPAVNEIYANGYLMEKLDEVPLSFSYSDVLETCSEIIATLETHLWHREFEDVTRKIVRWNIESDFVDYDVRSRNHHRHYVVGLLKDTNMLTLRKTMRRFEDSINWQHLRRGLTHGDPIIDNLMHRPLPEHSKSTPQLVLIDPIPACPAIPDVLAVDVGRVIQSAVGYEAVRYGTVDDYDAYLTFGKTHDAVNYVLNDFMNEEFTLNDVRASIYFAIIHMLRGVRTAQRVSLTRAGVINSLVRNLVSEAVRWTR